MKYSKRKICMYTFVGLNVIYLIYIIVSALIYGFNSKIYKTLGASITYISVYSAFPFLVLGVWAAIMSINCLLWCCLIYWILTFIRAFATFLIPPGRYQYTKKDLDDETLLIEIEKKLKCCNKNGPSDYTVKGLQIPKTCYKPQYVDDPKYLYKEGCIKKLERAYRRPTAMWFEIVLIVLIIVVNGLLIYYIKRRQRKLSEQEILK